MARIAPHALAPHAGDGMRSDGDAEPPGIGLRIGTPRAEAPGGGADGDQRLLPRVIAQVIIAPHMRGDSAQIVADSSGEGIPRRRIANSDGLLV